MANRRKPNQLHVLEGTFRKDRHASDAPQAPPASPNQKPPKSLGAAGKAAWREWFGPLCDAGIMTALDVSAFTLLCETHDRVADCEEALARDGNYLHLDNGSQKLHPAVGERFRWLALQRDLMRDFGLAPDPRQKLHIDPATVSSPGVAKRDRGVTNWKTADGER